MSDGKKAMYEDEMEEQQRKDIARLTEKTKDMYSLLSRLQKIQDCINALVKDEQLALTRGQNSRLETAKQHIDQILK